MRDERREVGAAGEAAVASWYEGAGFTVLDRNWRVRDGELDIVARRGSTVVFCEVKTRRSDAFGTGAEAVTARKQARCASSRCNGWTGASARAEQLRFDVASVRPDGRGGWIVDVFEAAF